MHQFLVYQAAFLDVDNLLIYERVADGSFFPLEGRDTGSTGFHAGPFEYYLMALPFALGLGFTGAALWLSLLWVSGLAATMLTLHRFLGARSAWLAGLVMANSFPYLPMTLNFNNNCLVPPFAAIWFAVSLDAAFRARTGPGRGIIIGLLIGLLPQVHLAMVFLFPATAVIWLLQKPRFSPGAWFCLAICTVLPWVPFFYHEIQAGWPNLTMLWLSGMTDNIPLEGPPRVWSWLLIFASPIGLFSLPILLAMGVLFILRRLEMTPPLRVIFLYASLQLLVPLFAYDFFKRLFMTIFLPAFPILCGLLPELLSASFRRFGTAAATIVRRQKRAVITMVVLILIVPSPVIFKIAERVFPGKGPLRQTGNLVALAKNGCRLGLPVDGRSWQNRIVGLDLGIPQASWDFLRRQYAAECPVSGNNSVLLVYRDEYQPDPQDRIVLNRSPVVFVGFSPGIEARTAIEDGMFIIDGFLHPDREYVYFSVAAHAFLTGSPEPRIILDGAEIPLNRQTTRRLFNGTRVYSFEFHPPPSRVARHYRLSVKEERITSNSATIFARKNAMIM